MRTALVALTASLLTVGVAVADGPTSKGSGKGGNVTFKNPQAKATPVDNGKQEAKGALSMDVINDVVKSRKNVFRACYQRELNREPNLHGTIVVRFVIDLDGKVMTADVSPGSTLKDDMVKACVKNNLMRLKFAPADGETRVTYPFVFSRP